MKKKRKNKKLIDLKKLKKKTLKSFESIIGVVQSNLKLIALVGLIFSSPILMDEVKDIYLVEYVAKKAAPVSIIGQVIASSFQLDYRGKRFTVTNKHVCDVLKRFSPRRRNPNEPERIEINPVGKFLEIGGKLKKILAIDTAHDICILEPDLDKPSFKLASFWKLGERITVIGHPRGLPQTIREGRIVSEVKGVFPWVSRANPINTFMIDAIAYGGNSGSPVVNRFGNVVGILFAGSRSYHTEALVVPKEAVEDFLDRFINGL